MNEEMSYDANFRRRVIEYEYMEEENTYETTTKTFKISQNMLSV